MTRLRIIPPDVIDKLATIAGIHNNPLAEYLRNGQEDDPALIPPTTQEVFSSTIEGAVRAAHYAANIHRKTKLRKRAKAISRHSGLLVDLLDKMDTDEKEYLSSLLPSQRPFENSLLGVRDLREAS